MTMDKNNDMPAGRRLSGRHRTLLLRFGAILSIAILIAALIVLSLLKTVIVDADDWNRMCASTLSDSSMIEPHRGDILASNGSILATNLTFYDVRIDFLSESFAIDSFVYYLPALADSLGYYFPQRSRDEWERHLRAGIAPPRRKRSRSWTILRKTTRENADKVRKLPFFNISRNSARTGLVINPVTVRSYPFGEMGRLSVGRMAYAEVDSQYRGRWGLECSLDTLLYGVPGLKRKALGTRGYYQQVVQPAIDGYDVTTTIDITVQDILEHELAQMLLETHAEWGAAMIMEVATGDIKAISNLERGKGADSARVTSTLNRIVNPYEPGSVMKVMTMAVALQHGWVDLDRVYTIGHSYGYPANRPIRDTHSPATLTPRQFICYSSNIGMTKLTMPHYEQEPDLFRRHLGELGFFDRLNTGLDRETPPRFRQLGNRSWDRVDLSRMVYGYSTAIPPLYTCAFYNAIANNGHFVRPRLVKALRSPDGVDSIIPVSYVRENMISEENAAILRQMMHDVVWEQGGTARCLKNEIVEIAGKTGTSIIALELPRNATPAERAAFRGGYNAGHNRVTFCGFFPYDNPKYTCIVVMNDPRGGRRGPAVTSGTVLMNTALKMHARGMLEPDPMFEPDANATARPVLHSSFDNSRNRTLAAELGVGRARVLRQPAAVAAGHVPDVCGVSMREALARLEGAGYAVAFSGTGFVSAQSPAAGTPAVPGTRVTLTLTNAQ